MTSIYLFNQISKNQQNQVRVVVGKNAYDYDNELGYFRLLSYSLTLFTSKGATIHQTVISNGKQLYNVNYSEYLYLLVVPLNEKEIEGLLLDNEFVKAK